MASINDGVNLQLWAETAIQPGPIDFEPLQPGQLSKLLLLYFSIDDKAGISYN